MANDYKTLEIPAAAFRKKIAERRGNIPAALGLQNLNEPVCFYQAIYTNKENDEIIPKIILHMQRAGYKCAGAWGFGSTTGSQYINEFDIENPNTYVIHETRDKGLELITPFYAPNVARENIERVLRTLSEVPGIHIIGAVTPTRFSQIEPHTPSQANNDKKLELFARLNKKYDDDTIPIKTLIEEYSNTDNYLFRGHTFMYSDNSAPFYTPTARMGRMGKVFTTPDIKYAMIYSGYNGYLASHNDHNYYRPEFILNKLDEEINIGFISVYKKSNKNIMFSNFGIEKIRHDGTMKRYKNDDPNERQESLVFPQTNPVVATYMVTSFAGGYAIPVDLSDPDWREFVDCFAPDITKLYDDSEKWEKNPNKFAPDAEYGSAGFGKHYFKRLLNQRDMFKNQHINLSRIVNNARE